MLSKEEIKDGYEKIFGQSINQEQIEEMFSRVDIDNRYFLSLTTLNSGFIDYSEFVVATMSEKNLFSEKKLKAAFRMFDTDDSGYISRDEVKESFMKITKISEKEIEEIVSQVDENGDGEISFEEFKEIMTKIRDS